VSAECGDGELCQQGTCAAGAGCATKCDCAVGQVCVAGTCDDPPPTCGNATDDCPRNPGETCSEIYRCESFAHECQLLAPAECTEADDCFGLVGCEEGCVCSPNGDCVPDAACTVATERDDCGAGRYCTGDLSCASTPFCASQSDCDAAGLVCDTNQAICTRPAECTTSGDCTALPPTTYCDTDGAPPFFCAVPNCLNGGTTCSAPQVCQSDGRCVTEGTGDECTTHATCPADQYCALVDDEGHCALGCRDDTGCDLNDECNAENQCQATGSLQPLNGPCEEDGECQVGLKCSFSGSCVEDCGAWEQGECDPQGDDCCALSAKRCCNPLGECSDGFAGNCL
jgi:hypothetical protein